MKKVFIVLLCGILTISLFACQTQKNSAVSKRSDIQQIKDSKITNKKEEIKINGLILDKFYTRGHYSYTDKDKVYAYLSLNIKNLTEQSVYPSDILQVQFKLNDKYTYDVDDYHTVNSDSQELKPLKDTIVDIVTTVPSEALKNPSAFSAIIKCNGKIYEYKGAENGYQYETQLEPIIANYSKSYNAVYSMISNSQYYFLEEDKIEFAYKLLRQANQDHNSIKQCIQDLSKVTAPKYYSQEYENLKLSLESYEKFLECLDKDEKTINIQQLGELLQQGANDFKVCGEYIEKLRDSGNYYFQDGVYFEF